MPELPQEIAARPAAARARRLLARAAAGLSLVLLLHPVGLGIARAERVPGSGGARIGDLVVPAAEIWQEYSYQIGARNVIHSRPADIVDEKVLRSAVDIVIRRTLLAREARARGFSLADEERAGLRAEHIGRWKGEASFQTALAMMSVSEQYYLLRYEALQLGRKMALAKVGEAKSLEAAAIRRFYQEHLGQYLDPVTAVRYVRLSGSEAGQEQLRSFLRAAEKARTAGSDYADVVRAFSVDPAAAAGGLVKAGGSEPHQDLAAALKPCRISHTAEDAQGLHLYVRDCRLPLPFEAVHERVRRDLHEQRLREHQEACVDKARAAASIELLTGEPIGLPPSSKPAH